MDFFTVGNLAESFSPPPAIHLSKGQARSSTWMLYYVLVNLVFSNSAHLQICAKFKQYSQIGEYFLQEAILALYQTFILQTLGNILSFLQLRKSVDKHRKSEPVSLLRSENVL